MRRSTIAATVSILALLAVSGRAVAQEPIRIGDRVSGALTAEDAVAPDDAYRYDDYRFTAREGQRLEITMQSSEFDTYIGLYEAGQTEEEILGDDDGFGQDTDSRLRFVVDGSGEYLLRARTLSGLDGGAYTLALSERPAAARAPRPTAIRLGQARSGALTSGDPETDDGANYDAYRFRARAGDRVGISLNSEDFDPVVRVGRMNGNTFDQLAENDDGPGGSLNSFLIFTAPESGEYIIRATPLTAGGEGAYDLSLAEVPEAGPAEAIDIGYAIQGELTATDGLNDSGFRVDSYRFTGRAGQRIEVTMDSDVFDTYLELFGSGGPDGVPVSLAEDDDGGAEGTNSRLIYTLPEDGDYRIDARGFSTDSEGAYTLELNEIEPERAPVALEFGTTVEGAIDADDPRDLEDRGYDSYVFSGSEGQRVQAIMRSGDFDTYLEIGKVGGEFSALSSDDDGLGEGTDSRLNFILPEAGDYVLRALPLGSESEGLYSIELIDRGPQPEPGSIVIGATARGTLSDSDAIAEDGSFYDAYVVHVKEGDKLVITLVSNEFDCFVLIGRGGGDEAFENLGSDDDGLSDTNSRLEWTAPSEGSFEIRAGSFGPAQTGAYALTVERQTERR